MDNTFICAYKRTPIGAFQGSLSQISTTKLGSIVIESVFFSKTLLSTFDTATTILSNNLKPFLITSIWPKVIGSKVPG